MGNTELSHYAQLATVDPAFHNLALYEAMNSDPYAHHLLAGRHAWIKFYIKDANFFGSMFI